MNVLIVGGVAAGTKVAAKLKRERPDWQVKILTKGPDISYAGCGLPYYVGHVIEERLSLIHIYRAGRGVLYALCGPEKRGAGGGTNHVPGTDHLEGIAQIHFVLPGYSTAEYVSVQHSGGQRILSDGVPALFHQRL